MYLRYGGLSSTFPDLDTAVVFPTSDVKQRRGALDVKLARDRMLHDDVIYDSDGPDDVSRSHTDRVVTDSRVGMTGVVCLVR